MYNQKIPSKIVTNDKIINTNEKDSAKIFIVSPKELYINIYSPTQEKDRLKKDIRGFVMKKRSYISNWP